MILTMADSITLPAAAKELAMSYERAKRLLLNGELKGEMIAGRWLVSTESVHDFLKGRTLSSTAAA